MKTSKICPCCSNLILRHLSGDKDYWFCRSCWQFIPSSLDPMHRTKANGNQDYTVTSATNNSTNNSVFAGEALALDFE